MKNYLCESNSTHLANEQRNHRSLRVFVTLLAALLYATIASSAAAQNCTVKPAAISLGQTVRLSCQVPATKAKLNDRTVRLFPQSNGGSQGLMPIAVADPPGAYEIEFLAENGTTLASAKLTIRPTKFPTQNVVLAPQIEALHSTTEDIQTLTEFRNTVSDVKYWEDPLTAPVPGCVLSPFGVKRLHNGKPTGEIHSGIDQRSPAGRPVRAVAAGTVKIAQPFAVLGGTVALDHGQGLETMYLHMSKLLVAPGAQVKKGEVIGYVGATGRANGPHLHWVVDVNGVPVNPQQWVALKSCGAEKAKPSTK
ncbi:MAG TPA: peptidoglycan DD-metalloendopeptidase family protein [Candidatus Acidoferrales bacterium]